MLPEQLREQMPDTEFEIQRTGQDVKVVGGTHPSKYPGASWPADVDFGDFKPDTKGGKKTFKADQKHKWEEKTHMLPYDPKTGTLLPQADTEPTKPNE